MRILGVFYGESGNRTPPIFLTITEAAKFYKITDTPINYNLKGKSKYVSAKQKITFSYLI